MKDILGKLYYVGILVYGNVSECVPGTVAKNIFTLLMSKVVSFYRGQLPNIIEMPGSLSQS